MLGTRIDDDTVTRAPAATRPPQEAAQVGWPARGLAGYVDGEHHPSP